MCQWLRRVWYAIRRRSIEAELAEEIEFHRAMKVRELAGAGGAARNVAFAVQREIGNDLLARDRARDVWIAPWLQSLSQDVRFAARLLVKDRWYALTAITTLALGLGIANTLITIVNASQRGLPVADADRVMFLGTRDARGQVRGVSRPDFEDWRAQMTAFADLAAFSGALMNVGAVNAAMAPELLAGAHVSAQTFRLLGVAPSLGRDFLEEDARPGAPAVAILSHKVWRVRYGGDASIIGHTILVNTVPAVVIGVMPEGFGFPFNEEIWMPLAARIADAGGKAGESRDARTLGVFGRLADHADLARARADMEAVAARLARTYPETNRDVRAEVEPFNAHYNGRISDPMTMALLGAVGCVLLIACANVANLLLSRSAYRSREIAVRTSLGATHLRIVRQLIVESLLLALLAGVTGIALSKLGVHLFAVTIADLPKPYWVRFDMDWRVFTVLGTICIVIAFLFGLAPAVHLAKTRVSDALKEGARAGFGSLRTRRWTGALVIAELALTVMLLSGGALMLRSFLTLYRADMAVDTAPVLTLRLSLPAQKYATPQQRGAFYHALQERLDANPAIAASAIASHLPFAGAAERELEIDGGSSAAGAPPRSSMPSQMPPQMPLPQQPLSRLVVPTMSVGARYFQAIDLPLLRGRAFRDADAAAGGERGAIVNDLFVAKYFAHEDPIGRRIRLRTPGAGAATATGSGAPPSAAGAKPDAPWLTIVGVAATMRQRPFREPDPLVYLPAQADPPAFAILVVRAAATATAAAPSPASLTPLLREEVRAIDPELTLFGVMPLSRLAILSRWLNQVHGLMFIVFASTALLLAAVGLYAVTAYSVTQRTQEIGLRIALGAPSSRIVWLFVRRVMTQLALGLTLGLAGALAAGRLISGALVKVSPADPATLAAIAILLTLVCAVACVIPARRAARLDALTALRRE